MSPYEARVEPDEVDGYRILVSRYGLENRAGPRLQRGVAGSGSMWSEPFTGPNREQLEQSAVRLAAYLNAFEVKNTKPKKRKRR